MNKLLVALCCILFVSVLVSAEETQVIVSLDNVNADSSIIDDISAEYDVTYEAQTVDAVSLSVTPEELATLSEREDINIRPAHDFKLFLSESRPIIRADTANSLQINGFNLTGRGQTVCVIDSGIDYTHSAFGSCTKQQLLNGQCQKVAGGYAFFDPVDPSNPNDIMDNWGHGTHISGIIAADGSTKGTAPGVRIVMMKACSPSANCNDLAVLDSLNWCLDNADRFDISVISMSLGHDSYASKAICDNLDPAYTAAFARAAAENIPVIVASGNGGGSGVAYPACLSNATAIGATTKSDTVAGFTDRNPLIVRLMAPGSNIISTYLGGGTAGMSGTSQAVPHVTGAIAILRQILDQQGQTRTISEIIGILENTGRTINDNGANYKRIDVYQAALSLDTTAPTITLNGPADNLNTTETAFNLGASATDWGLSSMSFQLRNSAGSIIGQNTFAVSGQTNSSNVNVNLSPGSYTWTFTVTDTKSNVNSAFRRLIVSPPIQAPQNQTNTTQPVNNTPVNQTPISLVGYNINSPRSGNSYNDFVLINISVGNANTVNYSINNGAFVSYTSPVTRSLPEGSHTLVVRASNSGTFNQSSITFNIVNTTVMPVEPVQNQTNTTQPVNNTQPSNQTNQTTNPTNNTNSSSPPTNISNQTMVVPLSYTIHNPVQGRSYNDAVIVNITRGTATRLNYSIDGGSSVDYSSPANIPLSEGSHTIVIRAWRSNNFSQSSITFNIVNTTVMPVEPVQNQTNTTQPVNNTQPSNQTNQTQPQTETPAPAPVTSQQTSSGGGGGGGGPTKKVVNSTNSTVVNSTDLQELSLNTTLLNNSTTIRPVHNITLFTTGSVISDTNESVQGNQLPKKIQAKFQNLFKNLIAFFSRIF